MKRIGKKTILRMLVGFLTGRLVFAGRNPLGAAYFVACFMQGDNLLPVVFCICAGMISTLSLEMAIRYGVAMLSVAIASDLLEQNGAKIKLSQCAIVMALTLGVLSVIQYAVMPFVWTDIFYAVMEIPFVLSFSRIFFDGQIMLADFFQRRKANHRESIERQALQHKLQDFADSFQKLSKVLEKQSGEQRNVAFCETYTRQANGMVEPCQHCGNGQNCLPQMARTIRSLENKLAQNRRLLASQMGQVGQLLENLAQDLDKYRHIPTELEGMIKKELGRIQVTVRNPVVYQDRDGHREIHIYAATTKGRLVTAREAAAVLSRLMGSPFVPSGECHHVIGRREVLLVFVENTPFYALTGVARMTKEGERVSGDTFSCLSLPNGELMLALSDGMGSGEGALEESRNVIELLEQMTEAGFSKISALKLINSLYMPESDENGFATADVVVVNLYQGNCRFIKNGAAATWIWRQNTLERIEGEALPVGVWQEAEPYRNKTDISSGDYVIMVTDGIVDAFQGREEEIEEILLGKQIINPQELAEYILQEAVLQWGGQAADDMSVVVAGIWERDTVLETGYKSTGRKYEYHESGILSQGETVL